MPVARFYLVSAAYPAEALQTLLEAASHFYAAVLYPELAEPPVERVRALVIDVVPDHWLTAGVPVSRGGKPAPFFTCLALKAADRDRAWPLVHRGQPCQPDSRCGDRRTRSGVSRGNLRCGVTARNAMQDEE
jgi:hypothetical protein